MKESKYQHEVIVPTQGLPFKLFQFEGNNGHYVREKHWHRSIEIFGVKSGSLNFILNDEKIEFHAGDIVVVNSYEVHAIHALRPNQTFVLQIPINEFANYYTEEQYIMFSHCNDLYDRTLLQYFIELYDLYNAKETGYQFLIRSKFYELEYLLVTQYRNLEVNKNTLENNKQLRKLELITGYLKEHYKEDISLESISNTFGYSSCYLSRMFFKHAQINYKAYLQSIRLEHALKDLDKNEATIGEIALSNGFANSKAFTKVFQRRYGVSPNEYRKQLKRKAV